MEKIIITLILLAVAISLPGCGFMGVTEFEMWKGGPHWKNVVNQKWSVSTEELPSVAVKTLRR